MTTSDNLYRLLTWTSPAYPIGGYAFSHGLENAVERALITDADSTREWIADLILIGDGQADLVFVSQGWESGDDEQAISQVADMALAFQPTAEIRLESVAQGSAFLKTTASAWGCDATDRLQERLGSVAVYPVVFGAVARHSGVDKSDALHAYAHGFVANLVSAAVRLVPLGQTDGQIITSALMAAVLNAVSSAIDTPLDDVSSSCIMADIASMQHEVQYTRLFRS